MRKLILWLTALLLLGCGHQAPQRPSQRRSETPMADSTQLALMEFNQRMADAADKQLLQWVQAQDEPYALYENNTWMLILDRGDEYSGTPGQDEEWTIHMRICNLDGRMLLDSEAGYRIGKYELPQGVDANIRELHHGAKARLLVPWYAAYGIAGTAQIPPYENVIIEIELR